MREEKKVLFAKPVWNELKFTYHFQPWPVFGEKMKSKIILIHLASRKQYGLQYTRYSDPFLSFVSIFNPGVYALNIRNFP